MEPTKPARGRGPLGVPSPDQVLAQIREHRATRLLLGGAIVGAAAGVTAAAVDRMIVWVSELVHAAGGTISLSWNDREPTPRGLSGASIRLFDAQDRPVAVNWNKGESHSDGFAIDYNALPCHAANALPEGSYTVRVQGQDLDVQKRIELRKGQEARVVFP